LAKDELAFSVEKFSFVLAFFNNYLTTTCPLWQTISGYVLRSSLAFVQA